MIKFVDVSKTYSNGTVALKNVSIEFYEGEFIAILGLSGAGKSTLLRTINQIIPVSSGSIYFNNIDVKKAGVFPIVQGIRSLALRERIRETTTVKRIEILEQKKILSHELAHELLEAFDVVGTLRLKAQIKKLQNNKPINNEIDTHTLSKIERDLLKDSFKIVINFKKFINHAFKIDKIS